MSQFLNIYLKPKGDGKPKFLACYSEISDVYGWFNENMSLPSSFTDEKYGVISSGILWGISSDIRNKIEDEQEKVNLRMKAIKNASNKEVADTFIEEVESLNRNIKKKQKVLVEIEHLLWLSAIIVKSRRWEDAEYDGLVGNIG